MKTVFVVLWYNYGDQGVDYLGVFSSSEKAEEFISQKISTEKLCYATERCCFDIIRSEVQ